MLMDGRPLPASSERFDERGAVISRLLILLPEEGERQRRRGGGGDGESSGDDVSMWEKMTGKGAGPEKDGLGDVGKRSSVLGAVRLTPLSQKAVQRGSLHYVKGGEQVELEKPLYAAYDEQSC